MWIIAGGTVLVLAVVLVFLQVIARGNIAYDRSDTALRCVHQDQCERPGSEKLIAEFQNTLSNLAYLLFGVCVLVRAGRAGAPAHGRPGLLMFGGGLCFLAVCSGWYHASLNFAGTHVGSVLRAHLNDKQEFACRPMPDPSDLPQLLDIIGVYAALIALFLYGVESMFKKELKDADSGWAKLWLVVCGGVLPLAALIAFGFIAGDNAVGGKLAGLLFASMLAGLCALTGARVFVSVREQPRLGLMWLLWSLTLIGWAAASYIIKPRLHWDSTAVFGVMMGLMLAVLGVNWSLSKNRVPTAEFLILGIVFILGIVPRLLDGYGLTDPPQTVLRKAFCGPDEPLQAHAVWHLMSGLALALTYDLLEKARPVYESAPATILLPQGREFSARLAAPMREQGVAPIMVKFVISSASLLLLFLGLYNSSAAALIGAAAVISLSALLWLWPLMAK